MVYSKSSRNEETFNPAAFNGRKWEIRTPGLLVPNQARYQTALIPELLHLYILVRSLQFDKTKYLLSPNYFIILFF